MLALWLPDITPQLEIQGHLLAKEAPTKIVETSPVTIRLSGFPARSAVRVSSLRRLTRWQGGAKGPWTQEEVTMTAWADIVCDRTGSVDLDRAKIWSGSFATTGASGLFWSGYPMADASGRGGPQWPAEAGAGLQPNEVRIEAQAENGPTVGGVVRFVEPRGIEIVLIATPTLNGCFAFPKGTRRQGALISLHGSEGGSAASARARALTFAANGIPTLAVNYFAWPNENIRDLAQNNLNTPVELLQTARNWLVTRPEVDPARIGLWGVSKGAEFAMVGAATFPWVRVVVGVVPERRGFGRATPRLRVRVASPLGA